MKLSIIVPILNEASRLPRLFECLTPFLRHGHDVILVDGGSTDESVPLALTLGAMLRGDVEEFLPQASRGPKLIRTERGRARQMNAGAQLAHGDVLVFLHADTDLPPSAEHDIIQSLRNSPRLWGRFDVQITGRAWMFPLIASMINLRSRLTGIASGDQAIFVLRKQFQAIGGFPDFAVMEDIALSKTLKRLSPPICLHSRVTTSGRRWEQYGIWHTIFLMWRLRWLYWRGVSPQELRRYYL